MRSTVLDSMVKIKLKRFDRMDKIQKWTCEQTEDTDLEPSVAEISIDGKDVLSCVEHNKTIWTATGGYKLEPEIFKRFKRSKACVEKDEIPNTKGSTTSESTEQIAPKFSEKEMYKKRMVSRRNTNCNPECSTPKMTVLAEKEVPCYVTNSGMWIDTGGHKLVPNQEEPFKQTKVCAIANKGEIENTKCAMVNEIDSDQDSDCMIIETPDSPSSDSMASTELNGGCSNDSDLGSNDNPQSHNDPICTSQNQDFEEANIALEIHEESVLGDVSKHANQFVTGDIATAELVDEKKSSNYELKCTDKFTTGDTETTGVTKAEIISSTVLKNDELSANDKASTDMVEFSIPASLSVTQKDTKFVHPQNKPDFLNAMSKIPVWNALASVCSTVYKSGAETTSSISVSGLSEVSITEVPNFSSNAVNLTKTPSTIKTISDFVQGFTASNICIIPEKNTRQKVSDYRAGGYLKESSNHPNYESVGTKSNPYKILKLDKSPVPFQGNECSILPQRISGTVKENINSNRTETPSTIAPLTDFVRDSTASNPRIPVKDTLQTSDYRAGACLKENSHRHNNESLGIQSNLSKTSEFDKSPVPPPRSPNTVLDNINSIRIVEPISTCKPTSADLSETTRGISSVTLPGDRSTFCKRVLKRQKTHKNSRKSVYGRCDYCNFEALAESMWKIHMVSSDHKKRVRRGSANRAGTATAQPPFANSFPVPHFTSAMTSFPARSKSELENRYNVALKQSNQELLQRHSNPSVFTPVQNPYHRMGVASPFESTHPIADGRCDDEGEDPFRVYRCCVCQVFSTDSFKELEEHVRMDRISSAMKPVVECHGVYTCGLCHIWYKDRRSMQVHVSSTKHLERLQYVNHLAEGGPDAAKRLLAQNSTQVCCNACDVYAPTLEELAAHTSDPGHKHKVEISKSLANYSALIEYCYCKPCGRTFKSKEELVKHADTPTHVNNPKSKQHKLRTIFFVKEKAPVKCCDSILKPEVETGRHNGSEEFRTNKRSKYLNHDLLSPGVLSSIPSSTSESMQHDKYFSGYPIGNSAVCYRKPGVDSRTLNSETMQLGCLFCCQLFPEMYFLICHLRQVHLVEEKTIQLILLMYEARMKSASPIEKEHFTNGDRNNYSSWNTPVAESRIEEQSIIHQNTNYCSSNNPPVTGPRIERQPIVHESTNRHSSWKSSGSAPSAVTCFVTTPSIASHSVTKPGIDNRYTTEPRIEKHQYEKKRGNVDANYYYSGWKQIMSHPSNALHSVNETVTPNYYETLRRTAEQPIINGDKNVNANSYSRSRRSVSDPDIANNSIIEPRIASYSVTQPRFVKHSVNGAGIANLYRTEPRVENPIIDGDKNMNFSHNSSWKPSVPDPSDVGLSVTTPSVVNPSAAEVGAFDSNSTDYRDLHEPGVEPLKITIIDCYSLQNTDSDTQSSPVNLKKSPLTTSNSSCNKTFTRQQIYTSESELESLSEDDKDYLIS